MLGLQKIKFFHGGTQYAPGVSGFDFVWEPDGTFRATAAFAEPVRVTIENEALFESVRDTLASAVRAGLAQLEQDHVDERALNVEICRRQYGSTAELWSRYHDDYLADSAARALRDAEDQARKEHARREAESAAAHQMNVEICRRMTGNFASWVRYPASTVREWATRAIDLAWDEAIVEDADRTAKKIEGCVKYFALRDRPFFAALAPILLSQWYCAIPSRAVV